MASPEGAEYSLGPIAEKGVVVTADGAAPDTTFDVETKSGKFSFSSRQILYGSTLVALRGRARVERLPASLTLVKSADEQDYPALAAAGDNVYLAYIEFAHGDRALEDFGVRKEEPKNFDWLSRPAGGDRVKLMRYSISQRKWSEPENVSPAREDCMRAAVAVDGRGRVWVVWSANRNGNFDLYARYCRRRCRWSKEIRVTSDAGVDLNPVATTDSLGRVWIAWQAFRGTNLDVMAAVQQGDKFAPEQRVSFSSASDWDPAIAAGPRGEVAVTWDTYDKGDYDVYARTMRYAKSIEMDKPVAVAASENFEARSSAAYDAQGRLWVAHESSGRRWGKDFGVYDKDGICLYLGHTIRVRVLNAGGAFETAGPLDAALRSVPGLTGREGPPSMAQTNPGMAAATQPGPRASIPRLAAGADGRMFLTFRSGAGERSNVGTIYDQYWTWYDGVHWTRPMELPHTTGPVDLRAAIHSLSAPMARC